MTAQFVILLALYALGVRPSFRANRARFARAPGTKPQFAATLFALSLLWPLWVLLEGLSTELFDDAPLGFEKTKGTRT